MFVGKGLVGSRFRLPLPFCVAFPFPLAPFPDRWGPDEGTIGAGMAGTWKPRSARWSAGTSKVIYRSLEWTRVFLWGTRLLVLPHYHK